jgi:hypothetical protein
MFLFLFKPYQYDKNLDPNDVTLVLGKNRNGPLDNIFLIWDGEKTAFSERKDSTDAGTKYKPSFKPASDSDAEDDSPFSSAPPPKDGASSAFSLKSSGSSSTYPADAKNRPAAEEEDFMSVKNSARGKNGGNEAGLKKILNTETDIYDDDDDSPFNETVSEELMPQNLRAASVTAKTERGVDKSRGGVKKSLREQPFDFSETAPNSVTNEPGNQEIKEIENLAKKDLPF